MLKSPYLKYVNMAVLRHWRVFTAFPTFFWFCLETFVTPGQNGLNRSRKHVGHSDIISNIEHGWNPNFYLLLDGITLSQMVRAPMFTCSAAAVV
ncbi:hypothetical protein chiPu_0003759 [Chiloscyllium punctatum]|uniref:Uncharacterized protein n=1 Tax=Chiloscyllium punctatum TaxID=137246 RepID=A0A401S4S9_CHIPU|nr:hypothetical protein [Chiloscyllium punctatum]